MNMLHYQTFVKIFSLTSGDESWKMHELSIKRNMVSLKKKYQEIYGVTDEQTIIFMELRKSKQMDREIKAYLSSCHVFELDEKHKFLLTLTKNPERDDKKLWQQVRLPFSEIFLDVQFTPEDDDRLVNSYNGLLIKEMKTFEPEIDSEKKEIKQQFVYGLKCYISGTAVDGTPFIDKYLFPLIAINSEEQDFNTITRYENKKEAQFFKEFIINFVLFLKEREVEWIIRERTSKNNERRLKEHKVVLPSSKLIRLTGSIKKYVDSISSNDFNKKFSFKFWVRGHWRTLRAERFVEKKDKTIWVTPYIKGEGVLIKKHYAVLPEDEDNTTNFDDIKPLDKPLRKMRL